MTQKLKVAIIDYEMGNLFSIRRACEYAGLIPIVSKDRNVIMASDALILPGVGAFGDAMLNLNKNDLIMPIKDFIDTGKPFMGICLGMQLLMTESDEFGAHQGLNIIEGKVVRLSADDGTGKKVKVPHMGWNRIFMPRDANVDFWQNSPLEKIGNGEFMYFVHSYYCIPVSNDVVFSITDYEGTTFCSGIVQNNVYAFQFHPEKSAAHGLKMYENFAGIINKSGVFN